MADETLGKNAGQLNNVLQNSGLLSFINQVQSRVYRVPGRVPYALPMNESAMDDYIYEKLSKNVQIKDLLGGVVFHAAESTGVSYTVQYPRDCSA